MKKRTKIYFMLVFLCFSINYISAQTYLSYLSERERDAVLVERVQNILKDKFPLFYREDIHPSIVVDSFAHDSTFYTDVSPLPERSDKFYKVTLYYNYRESEFGCWGFTAQAFILAKTGELINFHPGFTDLIYRRKGVENHPHVLSLRLMTPLKRDSMILHIAQSLLRDKFSRYYREDVIPVIEQRDFMTRTEDWIPQDSLAPNKVWPWEWYYKVTLYYKHWKKEGFIHPYTAQVYIEDYEVRPYKIRLGGEKHFRSLLKPEERDEVAKQEKILEELKRLGRGQDILDLRKQFIQQAKEKKKKTNFVEEP
jgi:hypothetical protein